MKSKIIFIGLILIILLLIGCTNTILPTSNLPIANGLISFKALDDSQATQQGVNDLVLANNKFAIDYYNKIDTGKNIFFSPFSISTALAMTYEGASGKTAEEMQNVFYFPENDLERRASFAKIYNSLNNSVSKGNYDLSIANSLWAEQTYEFYQSYFDLIEKYYYGKVNNVDFVNYPEEQRQKINAWVEEQTKNKIKDLLPETPPSITTETRLVLTNAIYFKGDWATKFKEENTKQEDFFVSENNIVKAQLMEQEEEFFYYKDNEFQYLELPYKGEEISMLIILPLNNEGKINYDFDIPTAEQLMELKEKMFKQEVIVRIPKIKLETKYEMKKDLQEMGLREAFTNSANFSKMDPENFVRISEIYHKAFVEINEEGTEAAAATAVVIIEKTAFVQTELFKANKPFAFIIKNNNEEILFMGKIVDPTKEN